MQKINLHTIFGCLVDDPNFLSVVIDSTGHNKIKMTNLNSYQSFNIMSDMVSDYVSLVASDVQKYMLFPSEFKSLLHPDHVRCGIKNFLEKNSMNINISFLNSLNILLRPEIFKLKMDDQIKNYILFENFVSHKIGGNCRIDKIKNTKKIQNINKDLIKNLTNGKISQDIIQFIINVFEINLLVFDFIKNEISFYWSCGHKYPYLNLFNDLFCMAYIQGVYEPIIPIHNAIPMEHIQKMYVNILVNSNDYINIVMPINLASHSLIQLNTWDIPCDKYIAIITKFFNESYANNINYNI